MNATMPLSREELEAERDLLTRALRRLSGVWFDMTPDDLRELREHGQTLDELLAELEAPPESNRTHVAH